MRAILVLADAASSHPDGTFSMLRGGINEVKVSKNSPIFFGGALVARITALRGEAGEHVFAIMCRTEDGEKIGDDTVGKFQVAPTGGVVNVVLRIQMIFPRFAKYEFSVSVDKQQLDAWTIEAKEVAAEVKK